MILVFFFQALPRFQVVARVLLSEDLQNVQVVFIFYYFFINIIFTVSRCDYVVAISAKYYFVKTFYSNIGPLQVASHVVQKHLAGEQETH